MTVLNLLGQHFSWARYLFQFSVFILFVGMLWGKEMLEQRGWRTLIVIPMLFIVVVLFIKRDHDLKATILAEGSAARKTAEEFVNSNKPYITSRQDTWFYDGLREIYGYFYGKNIETKIIPERERYLARKSIFAQREDRDRSKVQGLATDARRHHPQLEIWPRRADPQTVGKLRTATVLGVAQPQTIDPVGW